MARPRKNNYQPGYDRHKASYHTNKDKRRLKARLRLYGIIEQQYESLLKKQDFRCAFCKIHISAAKLCIDHCHESGEVRGLLCNKCNSCLGGFQFIRDNYYDLAITYLDNQKGTLIP